MSFNRLWLALSFLSTLPSRLCTFSCFEIPSEQNHLCFPCVLLLSLNSCSPQNLTRFSLLIVLNYLNIFLKKKSSSSFNCSQQEDQPQKINSSFTVVPHSILNQIRSVICLFVLLFFILSSLLCKLQGGRHLSAAFPTLPVRFLLVRLSQRDINEKVEGERKDNIYFPPLFPFLSSLSGISCVSLIGPRSHHTVFLSLASQVTSLVALAPDGLDWLLSSGNTIAFCYSQFQGWGQLPLVDNLWISLMFSTRFNSSSIINPLY